MTPHKVDMPLNAAGRTDAGAVLYISYDGMLEPLGQSQVIAYIEKLSAERPFHLISFEKPADLADRAKMQVVRDRLSAAGIAWRPMRYHKAPSAPATAFDVAMGSMTAVTIALRHRVRIVHARSYVPGLMALAVKRATGAKFVFDMRGFWADERVDGGLWPRDGRLFRAAKGVETRLLDVADHVVTLTHASKRELAQFPAVMRSNPPITVIPTCANLERFRPGPRAEGPLTLGYVGSFGTWYLLDEFMTFFATLKARRSDARMLVINRNEHAEIRAAASRAGIADDLLEIRGASHAEVPAQIARMHAATALIAPFYSKISSAPTKLAEYLGCGVPCVGNIGVGDVEEILEENRVGVVLRTFKPDDHRRAVDELLALLDDGELGKRCVEAAHARFSLVDGVGSYREIYNCLD